MARTTGGRGQKRAVSSNHANRGRPAPSVRRSRRRDIADEEEEDAQQLPTHQLMAQPDSAQSNAEGLNDSYDRATIIEEDAPNASDGSEQQQEAKKKQAGEEEVVVEDSSEDEGPAPAAIVETNQVVAVNTEQEPSAWPTIRLLRDHIKNLTIGRDAKTDAQILVSLKWLEKYLCPESTGAKAEADQESRRDRALALGIYPKLFDCLNRHQNPISLHHPPIYMEIEIAGSSLLLLLLSGCRNRKELLLPIELGFIQMLLSVSFADYYPGREKALMNFLKSLSCFLTVGDESSEALAVNCAFLPRIDIHSLKDNMLQMFDREDFMKEYPEVIDACLEFITNLVQMNGGEKTREDLLRSGIVSYVGKVFIAVPDKRIMLDKARLAIHKITSLMTVGAGPSPETLRLTENAKVIPALYDITKTKPSRRGDYKKREENYLERLKEILYDNVPDTWDDFAELKDIKDIHSHAIALGAYQHLIEWMKERQNEGRLQDLGACNIGSLVFACSKASDVLIPIELGIIEHAISTMKDFPFHNLVSMYLNLINNMIAQTAWDNAEETAKVNKVVLSKLKSIDSAFPTLLQVLDRENLSESPYHSECVLKLINNLIDSDENLQNENGSDMCSIFRSHGAIAKVGRIFEAFPTNANLSQLSRETIQKLFP